MHGPPTLFPQSCPLRNMIPVKIPENIPFCAAFPIDDEIVADGGTGIKDFRAAFQLSSCAEEATNVAPDERLRESRFG